MIHSSKDKNVAMYFTHRNVAFCLYADIVIGRPGVHKPDNDDLNFF